MSKAGKELNKEDSELIEILISVNRVAKVVKGGRRFGFSAMVIVGDGKGKVGFGLGKAKEVIEAKQKASQAAKKNMKRIYLREGRTLHHDIEGKFSSGKVIMRTAQPGTGIIAGGPMRAIFEALGAQDIVSKSIGSSNVHNIVRATFDGLLKTNSPRQIAERRSMKTSDVIGNRENGDAK